MRKDAISTLFYIVPETVSQLRCRAEAELKTTEKMNRTRSHRSGGIGRLELTSEQVSMKSRSGGKLAVMLYRDSGSE